MFKMRAKSWSLNSKERTILLMFTGLAIVCLGPFLSFNQTTAPEVKNPIKSVYVNPKPSSAKPSQQAVTDYNVPPNNPKFITIPAIGIANAPIVKLGLLPNKAIATPDNIYEAGWYDGSSLPGQFGAMFIYGHVSSWAADGVFYNLKKLTSGDKITITRGDNTIFTYEVVSSKIYPYNNVDMAEVLSPISASTPGLNLMTCTGQVIAGTSEFNERLVVFSSQISQ